jgi:hypothetical protein
VTERHERSIHDGSGWREERALMEVKIDFQL